MPGAPAPLRLGLAFANDGAAGNFRALDDGGLASVPAADGFGFELALAERGGQAVLESPGGEAPAFGHAALERGGPAALRNLVALDGPDGPAGMMAPGSSQLARETRFRAPPAPAGFPLISVPAQSTAIRFLGDLFAMPADFPGCQKFHFALSFPCSIKFQPARRGASPRRGRRGYVFPGGSDGLL